MWHHIGQDRMGLSPDLRSGFNSASHQVESSLGSALRRVEFVTLAPAVPLDQVPLRSLYS